MIPIQIVYYIVGIIFMLISIYDMINKRMSKMQKSDRPGQRI